MQLNSGTRRAFKVFCAVIIVTAAVQSFTHTKSGLKREGDRHKGEVEASFNFENVSPIPGFKTEYSPKEAILDDVLDHQALSQILYVSTAKYRGPDDRESLVLLGKVSRRVPYYLASEFLASAEGQDIERLVIAFDRLASVLPSIRAKLFAETVPILDEPIAVRLLARRQSRPWFTSFVTIAARQPGRLDQVAAFLVTAEIANVETREYLLQSLTRRFEEKNEIAKAQAFASDFGNLKGIDWNNLNFQKFSKISTTVPFAWRFPNSKAQPVIQSGRGLKFFVSGDIGPKPLAEKVLLFVPGRHRIEARLELNNSAVGSVLVWKIHCDSIPLRQESGMTGESDSGQRTVALVFDATEQCTGYRLSLSLATLAAQSEQMEIAISDPIHFLMESKQ